MRIGAAVLLIALAGCEQHDLRLVHSVPAVANPDYVVLRAVGTTGTHTATVDGNTLSYNAADRILDLRHLKPSSAEVRPPQYEGGHPVVWICTTPEGGKLLHDWTSQHVGQQLGVFVDGRLISAPHIMSAIDECFILDGGFTQEEAEGVAAKVKGGGA